MEVCMKKEMANWSRIHNLDPTMKNQSLRHPARILYSGIQVQEFKKYLQYHFEELFKVTAGSSSAVELYK